MTGAKLGTLGLLFLVTLALPVTSLGLSYEYLENNVLELPPGGNYYWKLILQNEQDKDVVVNVTMESDSAIIIGGGMVEVPAKTYNNFVYFNITIPKDAPVDTIISIPYSVAPVVEEEGQVTFAVRYDRSLKVRVYDPGRSGGVPEDIGLVLKEKSGPDMTVILLLLVIAALVVALVIKSKKK